jgi:hypothetical protein
MKNTHLTPSHNKPKASATIGVNLLSQSAGTRLRFDVSTTLSVSSFVEQALEQLAAGQNRVRVEQMREYYQPVLELVEHGRSIELDASLTLAEVGLRDNATLQIAARPLKDKLLFCRYTRQA